MMTVIRTRVEGPVANRLDHGEEGDFRSQRSAVVHNRFAVAAIPDVHYTQKDDVMMTSEGELHLIARARAIE